MLWYCLLSRLFVDHAVAGSGISPGTDRSPPFRPSFFCFSPRLRRLSGRGLDIYIYIYISLSLYIYIYMYIKR